MKSIRIQLISPRMISVNIVCDCGRNVLKNKLTGETIFNHPIAFNSEPVTLICSCGRQCQLNPQKSHFHVSDVPQAGFNELREPKDEHAAELWRKHGLGEKTSFELMEPIAQKLLRDPKTFQEGAEVVLGRRVDSPEKDIMQIFLASPEERFVLLLIQFETERTLVES